MTNWDIINHLLTAQSELAKARADLHECTFEYAAVTEAMQNITKVLGLMEGSSQRITSRTTLGQRGERRTRKFNARMTGAGLATRRYVG